jgi:predicted RecB family nuclease
MNTNMLENTQMGFFRRLEENEKVTDEAFKKMRMDLEEARKETNAALEKQRKALQDVQKESNENVAIIKKQANDIVTMKRRVAKIAKALSTTPKTAKLRSNSKLDAVGEVKPSLARGLKNLGVETVGQFLTMDPMVIAEKTMEPPDTVTSLQAKAQLLMVPGLKPNDAELLVKVGIASRKELANQDPVELCRTLVGIANVYVEQGKMAANQVPTIDDVWSWIKLAKP